MPEVQTIKMSYGGRLANISCPVGATYDEIIGIVIEHFEMPSDFAKFILVSDASKNVFEKDTFEYFILLFRNRKMIFYIHVDYAGVLADLDKEGRKPLAKLRNKRKRRDKYFSVPVTRQNCFFGALPGSEVSEDGPSAKKPRTDFIRSEDRAVKRTPSKKSIRI